MPFCLFILYVITCTSLSKDGRRLSRPKSAWRRTAEVLGGVESHFHEVWTMACRCAWCALRHNGWIANIHDLYQIFDDPKVSNLIQLLKLQWADHVQRADDTRISKRIFEGRIEEWKPVGKPWADFVTKTTHCGSHSEIGGNTFWRPRFEKGCSASIATIYSLYQLNFPFSLIFLQTQNTERIAIFQAFTAKFDP